MSEFRIESNCWYASTAFGASASTDSSSGQFSSPVRVNRFTPLKTGDGSFEIEFVQPMIGAESGLNVLKMKTLHRDRSGLLAKLVITRAPVVDRLNSELDQLASEKRLCRFTLDRSMPRKSIVNSSLHSSMHVVP